VKAYKYHFSEHESDITIISESKSAIMAAKRTFYHHSPILHKFIAKHQEFLTSFSPLTIRTNLKIVKKMLESSEICDVGPMATVAGAFADLMLEAMQLNIKNHSSELKMALVEDGGEIAIDSQESIRVALFAGFNLLNLNLGFLIQNQDCPIGIGTSSSTFGHAVSLGRADAVTVFAGNASLADGAATAVANAVQGYDIEQSIKNGLDRANDIDGIKGALICREDKVGQVGHLPKIFKIEGDKMSILSNKRNPYYFEDYEVFK
jgi:ApbE superfamily uncharacterized protein (UPF0280 family)